MHKQSLARAALHPLAVSTTLPKSWEVETGFHDALYDWMDRAPWYAVSACAHVFVFFVLSSIPWNEFGREPERVFAVEAAPRPPEPFVDESEVEIVESNPVPRIDEPELVDRIDDTLTDAFAEDDSSADVSDAFVDAAAFLSTDVGVGGGALGDSKLSGRIPGPGRGGDGPGSEAAVRAGLAWLVAHQGPDGAWSGARFSAQCGELGSSPCSGPGSSAHDVGLTGLALLALLGDGHSTNTGRHMESVKRGVVWLLGEQDHSGRIGPDSSHAFVYDHAIATLAVCEAYFFSRTPLLKRAAENAVGYIQRIRNPYGAWRYDAPGLGDNDTSVTGWMIFALASAKEAGLRVDSAALEGGLAWIDEVTDPASGHVGYNRRGKLSSRTPGNASFPAEKGEALTAVGILSRIFLGQTPEDTPAIERGAELLRDALPAWEPDAFACDMYYWYYGTYAMYQLGGAHWKAWSRAMKPAIVATQRTDGDARGSWDPVGPWGSVGGRVYSTALMTLSLEVYYRYARVLGTR